jgi:hypothetical protein
MEKQRELTEIVDNRGKEKNKTVFHYYYFFCDWQQVHECLISYKGCCRCQK